ncbi:MFS transporter [Paenibacillus sp. P25]|nr:MFS transporter [Paenibacillus sp. P25]
MNALQTPVTAPQEQPFGTKAVRIYLAALLFYTANHILLILLPLSSHRLGASPSQIGMIMGAYMFTSMFLRPVAGKVVDTFGMTRIFTAALVLNAAVISMYLIQELWVYALLRMMQGVILAFFSMISHLLVMKVLPEKSRGQGLSLFSLASMLPYTYGPFLALYMAGKVPMSYIFMGLIPISLATLFIGLNLRVSELDGPHSPETANPESRDPYKGWKDRRSLLPSAVMLLASAVIGTVAAFLPLDLEQRGLPYAGMYFAAETGVLITLRFLGRKTIPTGGRFPVRMIAVLVALITIAVSLVRIADSAPVVLLAAVCNGIALSMLYPTPLTYVSFIVPERYRGRGSACSSPPPTSELPQAHGE